MMYRLAMEATPIKRGTKREDGRIFWMIKKRQKKRYEIWLTPEQFKAWDEKRRNYARAKKQEYKKQQAALPPEERNYFGRQDPATGLYFLQVMTNGKPQFGTYERFLAFAKQMRDRNRNYFKKCKQTIPAPAVCVGDKHPTDPNLFVLRIWANKVRYGTAEKLQKLREYHRKKDLIYRTEKKEYSLELRRKARAKVMEQFKDNPELKLKRGDISPVTNEIFWLYDPYGREIWLNPEEFKKRRERYCENRRKKRANAAQNKLPLR